MCCFNVLLLAPNTGKESEQVKSFYIWLLALHVSGGKAMYKKRQSVGRVEKKTYWGTFYLLPSLAPQRLIL